MFSVDMIGCERGSGAGSVEREGTECKAWPSAVSHALLYRVRRQAAPEMPGDARCRGRNKTRPLDLQWRGRCDDAGAAVAPGPGGGRRTCGVKRVGVRRERLRALGSRQVMITQELDL